MNIIVTMIWVIIATIFGCLTIVSFMSTNNLKSDKTKLQTITIHGDLVLVGNIENAIYELKDTIKKISLIGTIGSALSVFAAVLSMVS